MKKTIILMSLLTMGFGFYAKAQFVGSSDLPADITQDFSSKYPGLTKVEWEKDGKHFKASFNVDQFAHEVVYDQNGKVLTNEFGLPVSNLPADVFGGLKKNFPDLKVAGADQLEEKGQVSYKVSLTDENNATAKVLMTADGRVIKTIVDEE